MEVLELRMLDAEAARLEVGEHRLDAPTLGAVQRGQGVGLVRQGDVRRATPSRRARDASRFDAPRFGEARTGHDADVGCGLAGRELDVLKRHNAVVRQGAGFCFPAAVADPAVALEAQAAAPAKDLAQGDQAGGAVEAVGHEANRDAFGQPGRQRFKPVPLHPQADWAFGGLNPPSQRQSALAVLEHLHQHLVLARTAWTGPGSAHPAAHPRPHRPMVPCASGLARERLHHGSTTASGSISVLPSTREIHW